MKSNKPVQRTPQKNAYLAVFSGAVAIVTTQGSVVVTPQVARLIQKQLDQAATRAEHASMEDTQPYAFLN
jgi:hypothetical protein